MKILWDYLCVMILWKLFMGNSWRGKVGWERVAYWPQWCQLLLLLLLSSWSHSYGICIDV